MTSNTLRGFLGAAFALITPLVAAGSAYAQTCVQPPAGLVSWWPGDGNANDIQASNHGSLQGAATFAPGLVGQAFKFNGFDGFVQVANSPSLSMSGDFTVEFWFSPSTAFTSASPTAPGLVSKGFSDSINLANDDGRVEVRGPSPRPNSTTNTWLAGTWYHLAVTYDDAAGYNVYVNGVLEGGSASSYSIMNNFSDLRLGSIEGFSPSIVTFDGSMDETSIYDRALSAVEIQAIVEAQSAGKCKGATEVVIDIKPGSFPNSINLSSAGVVPVAILGSSSFNAALVNPASVTLAGAKVKLIGKGDKYSCQQQDVNGDGVRDLLCHVVTAQFLLEPGDSIAVLEAETFSGLAIRGEDSIRIVPN